MNQVVIKNKDQVYIQIDCDEDVASELRDTFTFDVHNAKHSPKFKSGMWDGKIRLFKQRDKTLYRGLTSHVVGLCKARKYDYRFEDEQYDDDFSELEAKQFIEQLNCKFDARDYQLDVFVNAIRRKRGIFLSPTGSGKSLVAYLLTHKILDNGCKKGLLVVPTIALVEQMYTDFIEYSELNGWSVADNVHRIYGGKEKDSDKKLTVSTWQSLVDMPAEFFEQFDFIIGDEAHGFKSKSLIHIMTSLKSTEYRIGVTGTLDGTKTNKMVLEGLFGPVYKNTSTKELMEQGYLAKLEIKCMLLKHAPETCKAARKASYDQEIQLLVSNEARNRFIKNLVMSLNGNTLVLYQLVEDHGKILYRMIGDEIQQREEARKVFFVSGKVAVKVREEIRRIVETETNAIIVASFGTFSTGTNIKNLHNVVNSSPGKSKIRNLQSIGRGLRLSDTKDTMTLYDIADDLRVRTKENTTLKHFFERIKIYGEEQFSFKIYKIQLKG